MSTAAVIKHGIIIIITALLLQNVTILFCALSLSIFIKILQLTSIT